MSTNKTEETKRVVVPRTLADIQRFKLQKLLKNPDKPAFIPEKPEEKLPRVFKPPEFVRNIWGSSAGAGSGDFHVYRGVRRREYARQKFLDIKQDKQILDEEFNKRLKVHKAEAVERTSKKRAKRLKKKQKQKNKKMKPNDKGNQSKEEEASETSEEEEKKEISAPPQSSKNNCKNKKSSNERDDEDNSASSNDVSRSREEDNSNSNSADSNSSS